MLGTRYMGGGGACASGSVWICGEEKNFWSLLGTKPRLICSPTGSLVAIPPQLAFTEVIKFHVTAPGFHHIASQKAGVNVSEEYTAFRSKECSFRIVAR
jgi:hypothetical protein